MPSIIPLMNPDNAYEYIKANEGIANSDLFKYLDLPPSQPRMKVLKADDRLFWQKSKKGIKWFTAEYAKANNIPDIIRGDRYFKQLKSQLKREKGSRAGPVLVTAEGDTLATMEGSRGTFWLDRIMIPHALITK